MTCCDFVRGFDSPRLEWIRGSRRGLGLSPISVHGLSLTPLRAFPTSLSLTRSVRLAEMLAIEFDQIPTVTGRVGKRLYVRNRIGGTEDRRWRTSTFC